MRMTIGTQGAKPAGKLAAWRAPFIVALVTLAAASIAGGSLAAQTKSDNGNYTATGNTVFSFIDLVSGGGSSSVLSNTDDGVALLSLPFPFQFYGATYTLVCASSNGIVSFVTSSAACTSSADFANADFSTQPLPADLPALVPFWTDLLFTGPGAVYFKTQGTVGTRRFVIEYVNAYQPPDSDNPATFEVVLYEGSNQILFQYQNVDFGPSVAISKGVQAVIGIRDQAGQTNNRQILWSSGAAVIGNSTAILFTPVVKSYLVGDTFPSTNDNAGSFGDSTINTLDLLVSLRAVTNLPGSVPATCSDRFDAMDSFPVDNGTTRGGDGVLNILDLIETLKRATGLDTSLPTRTARGLTCSSSSEAPARRAPTTLLEGSLEFGTPVANGQSGWRMPIRLRARADLDLLGITFSAGYDSASSSTVLNFVTTGSQPGVVDREMPGKIAIAWLSGWKAKAGDVVDMGYIETSIPVDSMRLYGVSANAADGGRAVNISLPQQYRRIR
jgi:hypothetical protein